MQNSITYTCTLLYICMYIVMDMACYYYLFKERKRLSWAECQTVEPASAHFSCLAFEILKLPSFWHEKSPTFTFIIFLSNLTPMLEKEKPFDVFKRPLFKVYNFLKKKKTFSITKLLANQVNWNHFFIQKCGLLFSLRFQFIMGSSPLI